MTIVHYYLGRPARVWIAANPRRSPARQGHRKSSVTVTSGLPPPRRRPDWTGRLPGLAVEGVGMGQLLVEARRACRSRRAERPAPSHLTAIMAEA